MEKLTTLSPLERMQRVPTLLIFSGFLLLAVALLSPQAFAQSDSNASAAAPAAPATPAMPFKYDGAISAFAQVTGSSNGNSLREDTSESVGGLASFRQNYKPWASYELNYGYTKFSEYYGKGVVSITDDVHEFTAAYLVQAPKLFYGVLPFATMGTGVYVFDPVKGAASPQVLPVFLYTLGINWPALSDRLGVRLQFRGLRYKTPNFGSILLDTHKLRNTIEPTFGVYYRF